MRYLLTLLISLFFLIQFDLSSQNLIENGSFEEYSNCPKSFTKRPFLDLLPGWVSPDSGTPDYFNRCSKTDAGIPYNWAGINDAQFGDGYIGLYVYDWNGAYSESLKSTFREPLEKGEKYIFEFYYSLASYSLYSISKISIHFSSPDTSYQKIYSLDLLEESFIKEPWKLIQDTIIATGGENELIVGKYLPGFKPKVKHHPHRQGKQRMMIGKAYYYFDNFFLSNVKNTVQDNELFAENKTYALKNVNFTFDIFELTDSARIEIGYLVSYLFQNPKQSINIIGHTDEAGSSDYNLDLSKKRAKAVANYILFTGIDSARVTFEGKGETLPIEKTGDKSDLNRRVEFIFSKLE